MLNIIGNVALWLLLLIVIVMTVGFIAALITKQD